MTILIFTLLLRFLSKNYYYFSVFYTYIYLLWSWTDIRLELPINYMEQSSSWEPDSRLLIQKNVGALGSPKATYCIQEPRQEILSSHRTPHCDTQAFGSTPGSRRKKWGVVIHDGATGQDPWFYVSDLRERVFSIISI